MSGELDHDTAVEIVHLKLCSAVCACELFVSMYWVAYKKHTCRELRNLIMPDPTKQIINQCNAINCGEVRCRGKRTKKGGLCCYHHSCTSKGWKSKGEKQVCDILDRLGITYETQVRMRRSMSFDVYISSLKLLIEVDGEQHSPSNNEFNPRSMVRDQSKNMWITRWRHFRLLRLSYTDRSEYETLLKRMIQMCVDSAPSAVYTSPNHWFKQGQSMSSYIFFIRPTAIAEALTIAFINKKRVRAAMIEEEMACIQAIMEQLARPQRRRQPRTI